MATPRLVQTPASGFGRYLLRERLAAHATFDVFRAVLRGPVVDRASQSLSLKRMLPSSDEGAALTRQLASVGQQLMQLRHDNLVPVFDCGQIDGSAFLVTELVDGFDLGRWKRHGREQGVRFDMAAALYIVAQVARGLGHGHTRYGEGAVHGHLSPSSILISHAGEVKLAGFGLAATSMDETDPGERAVELGYFAPERLAGERVDARSDLFSLGLILYELLTGELPFDVSDPVALARNLIEKDIPKPSTKLRGLPGDVDTIVGTLLARDRAIRYQSANDLAHDLEEVLVERSMSFCRTRSFDRARLADLLGRMETQMESRIDTRSSSATLTALTPEPEPEPLPPPPRLRLVDSDFELEAVDPAPLRLAGVLSPIELAPPMRLPLPAAAPPKAARRMPLGLALLIVIAGGLWTSALFSLGSARRLPSARPLAIAHQRLSPAAARPTELAAPEAPMVAPATAPALPAAFSLSR